MLLQVKDHQGKPAGKENMERKEVCASAAWGWELQRAYGHSLRHRDLKEPSMATWCPWSPETYSREHRDRTASHGFLSGDESLRIEARLFKYPCCILIRTLGQRAKLTRFSSISTSSAQHAYPWLHRPKAWALRSRRLTSRAFSYKLCLKSQSYNLH